MKTYKTDLLDLRCMDCMELLKALPDKSFELAIVDPPYGIGFDGDSTLGNYASAKWPGAQKSDRYALKEWDRTRPSQDYFDQLLRVSKRAIVWGGNWFAKELPVSGGWIVWDKGVAKGMSLSGAELAWSNCKNTVEHFSLLWAGFRKCELVERIHPTQKPVELYRLLLATYAKPGDRILDTHLGSGSIAVAAFDMGFHLTATELDAQYFADMVRRVKMETRQTGFGL